MSQASSTNFTGPVWDNSSEYRSLTDSGLIADIQAATAYLAKLETSAALVAAQVPQVQTLNLQKAESTIRAAQQATAAYEDAKVLLGNISTFVSCELSVNGRNDEAKAMNGKLQSLTARLQTAYSPVGLFLQLCADDIVEAYLKDPKTESHRFLIMQERRLKPHVLSLAEESLLIGLQVDGHQAWDTLYTNLSGIIECHLEGPGIEKRTVGLAAAASLQQDPDPNMRQAAYSAINKGWQGHEESCAAALNALAGWRHTVCEKRSHTKPFHYLDSPLNDNRITRATLDAMLGAVKASLPELRSSMRFQAKLLGKEKLNPWDLDSPCPAVKGEGWKNLTFNAAMELIIDAFNEIDPDMGSFAKMMMDKRWIEGSVGPAKRPGAYCTQFRKSRTPRVYMTFNGGMREIKTLAHELGHAYHAWIMRDLPLSQSEPPMTLAETASTFAETVIHQRLLSRATTPAERLLCQWTHASETSGFLINVPSRFAFESAFYVKRREGPLSVQDIKQLMSNAWQEWYGDTLTETNQMFWASKLHFYISELSFYNFPYVFGYLFALGVYAQREKLGSRFSTAYVALLRDTGRMTAEEVAHKHLGVDLSKPDFWNDSLELVKLQLRAATTLS